MRYLKRTGVCRHKLSVVSVACIALRKLEMRTRLGVRPKYGPLHQRNAIYAGVRDCCRGFPPVRQSWAKQCKECTVAACGPVLQDRV